MKLEMKYLISLVILSNIFTINSYAQRKQQQKSTLTPQCKACLNAFSPETLDFPDKYKGCPNILARCITPGSTNQCEEIINNCFMNNCIEEGSCSDEISNRNLAYGCLTANSSTLGYKCSSYISALSKNMADQIKTAEEAKTQAYQAQLKQQEAQIASQQAAAKQAEAEAQVKAAQAEANAKTELARIEAENKLKLQQQEAELEEQAKEAELARQQKLAEEARNNKPNVRYNNILATVKKDISSAKTYTSKIFNMMGIIKTTDSQNQGTLLGFPAPVITVYGITTDGSAKSQTLLNGSRYKSSANFKCTKDVKESYVKNELNNAYNVLLKSRDNLSTSITELESLNADEEASGRIGDDKINSLYAMLNKMNETINTFETELTGLKTTCETRCEGMANSLTTNTEIEFDENGLIKENSGSSGYSCKDFEENNGSNDNLTKLLTTGKMDLQSMMGGIGQQVTDLTKRVLGAVLNADRSLEELNIAASTGSVASSNTNYSVINSCNQYIMDISEYTNCIKNVMSSQISILSQQQGNQKTEYYQNLISEFNKSVKTALDLVNSDNYKTIAQCDGKETMANGCEQTSNNIQITDITKARQYALNLSSRLSKAANKKNTPTKTDSKNDINILGIKDGYVTFSAYGMVSQKEVNAFIKDFCTPYAGWTAETTSGVYTGEQIILTKPSGLGGGIDSVAITATTFNEICNKKP